LAERSADAAPETAALIPTSIGRSRNQLTKVGDVATEIRSIMARTAEIKQRVDEIEVGTVAGAASCLERDPADGEGDPGQYHSGSADGGCRGGDASQSKAIQEVFRHFAAMGEPRLESERPRVDAGLLGLLPPQA
jgi:hypothetical protein